MYQLRSVLTGLEAEGAALSHFNVSDLVMLKAVFAASVRIGAPVLVGASEGERDSGCCHPRNRRRRGHSLDS